MAKPVPALLGYWQMIEDLKQRIRINELIPACALGRQGRQSAKQKTPKAAEAQVIRSSAGWVG
jgi:hypothetical protein